MRLLAMAAILTPLTAAPGPCVTRPPLAPAPDAAVADGGAHLDASQPADGKVWRDATERPDLGRTFCTEGPQLDLNAAWYDVIGWEPTVEARVAVVDGYEAAALIFTPPDGTANRVVFRWQAQRGVPWAPTTQVNLLAPPVGFSVTVMTGCEEPLEQCASPTDSVTFGDGQFMGSLEVSGLGGGPDYTTTLCLNQYTENPFELNPIIRYVGLWSGGAVTASGK